MNPDQDDFEPDPRLAIVAKRLISAPLDMLTAQPYTIAAAILSDLDKAAEESHDA